MSSEIASRRSADIVAPCVGAIVEVPLGRLHVDGSPRENLIDDDHVISLAENFDQLPPIVIEHPSYRVLDGIHRLAAAHRLGRPTVRVELFVGPTANAYVESVQRNVAHGRPLTMAERREAVRRILRLLPDWSDRRIATSCGVSAKTVAAARQAESSHGQVSPTRRVGVDGRSVPTDLAAHRSRVTKLLRDHPDASTRELARAAGVSSATIRSVRSGATSVRRRPATQHGVSTNDIQRWKPDAAYESTEAGRVFVRWFAKGAVDSAEFEAQLAGIPLSRMYDVVAEARTRSELWRDFANHVERVARRQ